MKRALIAVLALYLGSCGMPPEEESASPPAEETLQAPGPDIGSPGKSKECEEAEWKCLEAMFACYNPASGCRIAGGGHTCCVWMVFYCTQRDQICKRETRRPTE